MIDKEQLRWLDKINYGIITLLIVLNIIAKGFMGRICFISIMGFCLVMSFVLEYLIKRK